ncbi:MAG: YwiC-like family protein [Gemmatimonadota bacterium]|nr:MAG: YwiC-like family protein [Gemmatimonadota bacterium]
MTQTNAPHQGSLLPREHGAYAQISFPLLTALSLGKPGPASILLVMAAVTVFLLHEPVLILIGGRGGRAKRELAGRARRRTALLIALALLAGLGGLALAPAARLAALIPLGTAALLLPLIFSRREKTTAGELLVALSLSSTMIPVARAGGVNLRPALLAAAVWAIVFALGTVTVRMIIARAKKGVEPSRWVRSAPWLSAAVIAGAMFLAFEGSVPAPAALAAVPTAAVALVFALLGVHPRNLRRMGWSLVASNVAVMTALIIAFR